MRRAAWILLLVLLLPCPERATGSERFEDARRIEIDAPPVDLVSADLDRDGHADLAVVTESPSLLLLFGSGDGHFPRREENPLDALPGTLLTSDLDGDGHPDLLVHFPAEAFLEVLLTTGSGALVEAARIETFPDALVHLDDLDRDGAVDLLQSDLVSPRIQVFPGRGDGTFRAPVEVALDSIAPELTTGDVNGDRHVDLVTGSPLTVYLGDGQGRFLREGPTYEHLEDLAIVDYDQDGHADIAGLNPALGYARALILRLGDGKGRFDSMDACIPTSSRQHPIALATADLTGDGLEDYILSLTSPSYALFARQNGRCGVPWRVGRGLGGDEITTGDHDGDGSLDIAWIRTYLRDPVIQLFLNRSAPHYRAREGAVHDSEGRLTDVLFVNDSPGAGIERRVTVSPNEPIEIRLDAPPSREGRPTRYALYLWRGTPGSEHLRILPSGLGMTAMPTPLNPGPPFPKATLNNLAPARFLGASTVPAPLAPGIIGRVGRGFPTSGVFFLQSFIRDESTPLGEFAVTNGVLLSIHPPRTP